MAQDLIDQYEFPLNARDTVDSLGIGLRQLVEILKGLSCDSELLIMDEPTASLSGKEATILFSIIHKLRDQGVSIIYISHRLEEVYMLSDRLTILRDGRNAADSGEGGNYSEGRHPDHDWQGGRRVRRLQQGAEAQYERRGAEGRGTDPQGLL